MAYECLLATFFMLLSEAYLPAACLSDQHLTGDWCQIWALFTRHVKVNVCVFLAGLLVVCGPQCLYTSSLISSLISRYGFGHPCHIPLATHYHHKHRLTVTSTILRPTVQLWDLSDTCGSDGAICLSYRMLNARAESDSAAPLYYT